MCSVDGSWGLWQEWGSCSELCGGGNQKRIRVCNGGADCIGLDEESVPCNEDSCSEDPGKQH